MINNNRRRNFRPRPQKNNFRRRNDSSNSINGGGFSNNVNSSFNRNGSMTNPHNVEKTIQKYQQLAKDAQSTGDPVLIENYLQHADHFGRRLAELNERNKVNTLNEKPNVNNEEATLKEKTEPLEKPKDLPQSSN